MAVDVLFTGSAVFTGSGAPRDGLAVGVTDGRIVAIVPEREAESLAGPETQRVHAPGALLSPGFQDGHIHPTSGGVEALQCDLTSASSAEDAVRLIADYAQQHPEEPWILGGGWSMDHFAGGSPLRGTIDAVVPDRPVLLMSRDHHSAWANTAAIRAAGIDASTEDPADGRIERETDGFPAGTFHEGAGGLFLEVTPAATPELVYRGLLHAQQQLLSLGVTGWQDAMIGDTGPIPDSAPAYRRAIAEGTLRVHVVGAQWWQRDRGLEQIDDILRYRDECEALGSPERFQAGTVKIMLDGVAENFTASMLTPYRDAHGHDTHNHGISFVDTETLREAAIRLDAAGMQLHFHALGDRAVRDALDAVAAARAANGPSDGRHHLAHLQVVAEADTSRFAEVDAVANLQMLWATHEEQIDTLTLPFMQEGQEARQYPFGDLVRGGARLAAGSDWPVSSANPLEAIMTGVTRVAPGIEQGPLGGAQQRLSLEDAFAAYTSGTAYINHRDHDTGYVKEGYLANLVVIEPNPFAMPSNQIHRAQVASTWVEGVNVYTRPASN